MFIKNDPTYEKKYYNGKIGRIVKTEIDKVIVESDGETIEVKPIEWENMRYSIDEETKAIKEMKDGSFTQIPLKPAWAITVHKSQ
jgi:ATP-dependent exoDNAse (exonuclease V) alpha subunit